MTATQLKALAREAGEGDDLWVIGGLYTFRIKSDENGGAYSLCEVTAPDGFAIPVHYHEAEEEAFYVLEGEVTIFLGDQERRLRPGGLALAPRGVQHSFRLESEAARMLLLFSPGGRAHEALFQEMGEPAAEHVIPPAPESMPDPARLAEIAARHGTRMVGPPPFRT